MDDLPKSSTPSTFKQSQDGDRKCFWSAEWEMALFVEEKRQQPKTCSK